MCWHVRAIRRAILSSHNLSWFTCRPGKHQRHRAFLSVQASSFAFVTPVGPVSVSATGLFAGRHYVYPAYIVPTACTAARYFF